MKYFILVGMKEEIGMNEKRKITNIEPATPEMAERAKLAKKLHRDVWDIVRNSVTVGMLGSCMLYGVLNFELDALPAIITFGVAACGTAGMVISDSKEVVNSIIDEQASDEKREGKRK